MIIYYSLEKGQKDLFSEVDKMNDVDMWNDIEDLERLGLQKEAKKLHKEFIKKYIEVQE